MKTISIDTETYYDKECSVTTLGGYQYVRADKYECYMLTAWGDDGYKYVGRPEDFDWDVLNNAIVPMHNAQFDTQVIKRLQETGVAPKHLGVKEYVDTADLAAYLQMPRALDKASFQMLGVEVSKEARGNMKGRYWAEISDRQKEEMRVYGLKDAELCYRLWMEHGHLWPSAERRISEHTRDQMYRGMRVDIPLLDKYLGDISRLHWEAEVAIPWREDAKLMSRKAFDMECRKQGLEPPKSLDQINPLSVSWIKEHSITHQFIRAFVDWRRLNILKSKLQAIKDRVRTDGRVDASLKYFGAAATGRWSGAGNQLNLQNLPVGELFGVDIRRLFIAKTGKVLLKCDLSSIEPRCGATMMGDEPLLQLLREGNDVYQAHAKLTLGYTGDNLKKDNPELRDLAKVRVLSLGYGTGWERLQASALERGVEITQRQAQRTVAEFRESYPLITRSWEKMDIWIRAAEREAVKTGSENVFELELTSGRLMKYFKIARNNNGVSATTVKGAVRTRWWGSKLYQGACQAMARDVFTECILRADNAGFYSVLHVHDELVCEVDEGSDPRELEEVMKVSPDWDPDLPLDAESKMTPHYC